MLESFLNYIRLEKKYSLHTVESYSNDLSKCEDFFLLEDSSFELKSLTIKQIRLWVSDLSEKKYEARSINRKLASLSSYFKFLQLSDSDLQNPVTHIKLLKTPQRLPTFVPKKDMEKPSVANETLEKELNFEEIRNLVIVELLYGTGMRSAELIGTQDSDINFYNATIKILGKGNKERIIPIHAKLLDQIKEYILLKNIQTFNNKSNHLIVTNSGDKAYPMFVRRIVSDHLQQITLTEKKSPHVLRHTFATHMLDAGADLLAIKEIMGHASLASTQVYTHNSMEKLKKAFEDAHPKAKK